MIKCRQDAQYLSYILDENSIFSLTAFRVLKKQQKNGLLACYRNWYNGGIKLLYPVSGMTALSVAAGFWSPTEILDGIRQILKILMAILENGFLQMETVDPDISHMFCDYEKKQIFLIALPLQQGLWGEDLKGWELYLKKSLVSLIELGRGSEQGTLYALKKDLEDPRISLGNLYYKYSEHKSASTQQLKFSQDEDDGHEESGEKLCPGKLSLTLKNQPGQLQFMISQPEFVLGKNGAVVDGLVNLSPTISRTHCKIWQKKDGFFVEDLKSKNFTWVNGIRLEPGILTKLEDGDVLRLAKYDFDVKIL